MEEVNTTRLKIIFVFGSSYYVPLNYSVNYSFIDYFRQILLEGPLTMVETSKPMEMYIILFDDMLLITRRKKALSKKVVHTFITEEKKAYIILNMFIGVLQILDCIKYLQHSRCVRSNAC